MVRIAWLDDKPGRVEVSWKGSDQFNDLVELAKSLGLQFDPKRKSWVGRAIAADKYLKEYSEFDSVEVDAYSRRMIDGFRDSITELRIITNRPERLRFLPELMSKPPLDDIVSPGDPSGSFQVLDTVFLMNRNRGIANHDCGMGKSYILTAILEHLRHYGRARKALIFSSNIGVVNLRREMVSLGTTMSEDDILLVTSVGDVKDRDIFDPDKYPQSIIIIGYDTFRHVSDFYDRTVKKRKTGKKVKYTKSSVPIGGWLGGEPGVLFLDESHYLGSPDSLRTKAIDMVKHHFEYRYEMTATYAPVYEKMYSPMKVLDPGLTDDLSYHEWLSKYVVLGNAWSDYAIDHGTWDHGKLDDLNRILYSKYAVKRRRTDHLDLPPLIHVPVLEGGWTRPHRKIYEAFCRWYVDDVTGRAVARGSTLVDEFSSSFQFAMLAVENPSLLMNSPKWSSFDPALQGMISNFEFNRDHSKVRLLDDVLDDRVGELDQKVMVFYYHPLTKEALVPHLKKYDPHVVSAELSRSERMEEVERFKSSRDSRVLLLSIKCASTSITVTEAKSIVFFETGWDGIDYDQACGRNHRPGQDEVTHIYDLRLARSYDLLQFENLRTKGEVIRKLLARGSLSEDGWRDLFAGSTNCGEDRGET